MKLFGFGQGPKKNESTARTGGSRKIYSSDIKKISSGKFGRVKIGDQEMSGNEVKSHLQKLASGGVSAAKLEKELKKGGVSGSQIRKRKEIMAAVSKNRVTSSPKPIIRRALAEGFDPVSGRFKADNSGAGRPAVSASQWKAGQSRTSVSNGSGGGYKIISSAGKPGSVPTPSPPTSGRGTRPLGL